jgi:hypothetical protein
MELYVGERTYTFWRYLNDRAEKRSEERVGTVGSGKGSAAVPYADPFPFFPL